MADTKTPAEARETHVHTTDSTTKISNEFVKGASIKFFAAGPQQVGIRNSSGERKKVVIQWEGAAGKREYTIDGHSQLIVTAPHGHGQLVGEHPADK